MATSQNSPTNRFSWLRIARIRNAGVKRKGVKLRESRLRWYGHVLRRN